MGIKFLCPNGHKLHVKSFLAGKRAICPKCGARVTVPAATDEQLASGDPTAQSQVGSASATIEIVVNDTAGELTASPPTQVTEPVSRSAETPDAIAKAPNAVWYVRPATGGQFGPAKAEVMRSWLDDGRVSASSLVWRAGWPEWQTAGTVFPQLGQAAAGSEEAAAAVPSPPQLNVPAEGATAAGGSLPQGFVVQTVPTAEAAPVAEDSGASPISQTARRRRRQRDVRLYASAVLAVVAVILMVVLFLVFRRGNQPAKPTAPESAAEVDPLMK